MIAQQTNLDVIANNLANVNTTGFKQQRAEFQDMVYQTLRASGAATSPGSNMPQSSQVGLGAHFSASSTSFQTGAQVNTGNPTNLYISGQGFFQIQKDGDTFYTRDGSFRLDAEGQLVTVDGYLVDPGVTVPGGSTELTISDNGSVWAKLDGSDDVTQLGEIQLAVFTNPAGLTRVGQNLFRAGGASGEPQVVAPGAGGSGSIEAGFVEGSNVQIVEEMVRMITAQRAYEINSKAIQTADDMLGILNNLKR
jgi:flagellar basal-body rod protein FlgG